MYEGHEEGVIATHTHHVDNDSIDVYGFWLYIMTDCVLFGCLFATFITLTFQGAQGVQLKTYVDLSDVLIETFFLLASNFAYCLAILALYQQAIIKVQAWLVLTFILGASFIFIEVREFLHLASEGFRWDYSGQASSFFTLVGTHGLHVTCGLIWILFMIIQLPLLKEINIAKRRMTYLGLFWNFLDIVWIFVFTVVYLTSYLR